MPKSPYYDYDFREYEYSSIATFPAQGDSLARFKDLLPISELKVSLGEGNTPITKSSYFSQHLGLPKLYIKHEELNPTGCFKDRESAVIISAALEQNKKHVYVVSSGNAALSTAAYAAKAGIKCDCFVPSGTSEGKKKLIRLFGATLTEIDGNYEQVYRYVADHPPAGWNVTPGMNGDRIEGNKTIAYEIWLSLGEVDVIVVPCGNGGNLAAIGRGFWELQKLGLITKLPRLIGVQMAGAAPLKLAQSNQTEFEVLTDIEDSIAEGIIAEESYCSPKAMWALRETEGSVVEVTEDALKSVVQDVLQKEVVIAEPTSIAAFAALPQIAKELNNMAETVVIINTGSGMKDLFELTSLVT